MSDAHEMETTREFDIHVDFTYTPGLPEVRTGHPDNWAEEEPGTVELVAVSIGHINILPQLRDDEINELTVDCEAELAGKEPGND